ncbi:MAG: hypothetical protein ACLRWM_02210 [Streptococcus sp.]
MTDSLCLDLVAKIGNRPDYSNCGYDKENIKTDYSGEIKDDRYGRKFQNMLMELSI